MVGERDREKWPHREPGQGAQNRRMKTESGGPKSPRGQEVTVEHTLGLATKQSPYWKAFQGCGDPKSQAVGCRKAWGVTANVPTLFKSQTVEERRWCETWGLPAGQASHKHRCPLKSEVQINDINFSV